MGASSSKCADGKEIGTYANGAPICQKMKSTIDHKLSTGELRLEKGEHDELWGQVEINGTLTPVYYSRLRTKIIESIKQGLIKTGRVAGPLVSSIAVGAAAVALALGVEAAVKYSEQMSPQVGPIVRASLSPFAATLATGIATSAGINVPPPTGAYEPYPYEDRLYLYEAIGRTGGFTGGADCRCGGWIGGDEQPMDLTSVRDYAQSANAAAKDAIIDSAIDMMNKLGLKVEGNTRAEKVKSMVNIVGDKTKFKTDAHKGICVKLANVINSAFGEKVINKDLPPEVICQQVAEMIGSIGAEICKEFYPIYLGAKNVVSNLHTLRQATDIIIDKIKQETEASDDATLQTTLAPYYNLHEIINAEIHRQTLLMENLLKLTLRPAEKDLTALIKSSGDVVGLIKKIDIRAGTDEFSKVLRDLLNGIGITAQLALLVDKALKTVGMTLEEFSKDKKGRLLEKLVESQMGKQLSDEKLHEFRKIVELLEDNLYRKEDLPRVIKERALIEGNAEDNIADMDVGYEGGDDASERYHKTVMDRRIADRAKLKNLIFAAFYNRLSEIYDALVSALDKLSSKVGTEIPLSDQLDNFRHIIQRINEALLRNKNVYQALIGYYNDALSRSKREQLVADFNMIISYINNILELPQYKDSAQYFKDVQTQMQAIIDLINKFSDEITLKFGRGELIVGSAEDDEQCEYIGSADTFSREPQVIKRSTKQLSDALRKFDYYYRVAQIKNNLSRTSQEHDHYSEKYEKIIANSILDVLDKHKKQYERARKELAAVKASDLVVANSVGFHDEAQAEAEKTAALEFLDTQWEARKKFWATVEAIDAYMRVFTDGLVKNPNDIKDIKSMLDEIEVISDWYNENTGNNVAGVFDYFPSFMNNNSLNASGNYNARDCIYPPEAYRNETRTRDVHYYEKIHEAYSASSGDITDQTGKTRHMLPGNPYLVTVPSLGVRARAQIRRTMMGLAVLKNLISVFVHIGSKFGGEELRKKVFLTPAQIYNNLVEYLQTSAFSQGFGTKESVEKMSSDAPLTGTDWTGYTNFNLIVRTNGNINKDAGFTAIKHTYEDANNTIIGVMASAVAAPAGNASNLMLFKKRWGVWMRSIKGSFKGIEGFGFQQEDEYFVLMLKSIAAKIFTVTGMYDVLDRPLEINSLSPVRMIIGGDDSIPKVDENAVELYLRLPLLAQFYRNIFGYDEMDGHGVYDENNTFSKYSLPGRKDTLYKISMVPDVDGVFAGLIKYIFRRARHVQNQTYSDDDVKEIIKEINLIYQRMLSKYPQNTIMETFYEFVTEINRRYGIISREERNKYENEFGYRYDYYKPHESFGQDRDFDRYSEPGDVDYAILPGETDDEIVRPSSAEKLLSAMPGERYKKSSLFSVVSAHKNLVYKFRCAIDKLFENPDESYTFKNAIKAAQNKLKKETRDEDRFKIVSALIRGVDIYSKADGMKYALFHETVVAGLNTLSAIHSFLQRFKKVVLYSDLRALEDHVWDILKIPGQHDVAGVVNGLTDRLHALNLGDDKDRIELYVKALLGFRAASSLNGGHLPAFTVPYEDWVVKRIDGIKANDIEKGTVVVNTVSLTAGMDNVFKNKGYKIGELAFADVAGDGVDPYNGAEGVFGLIRGFTHSSLKSAHRSGKNTQERKVAETFMRFLFDREFVMRELLESLFGISTDLQGLVDIKIEDGKIYINFGGVKKMIDDLFASVSYFIDLLRPHIKTDVLERYITKTNPGSYYWLQEQLMEKIIIGRPEQISPYPGEEKARAGYISLDELAQRVNNTYQILTKEYDTDGANLSHSGSGTRSVIHELTKGQKSATSYDKVFAELIFYDAAKPGSGLLPSKQAPETSDNEATGGLKVVDFRGKANAYEMLHFAGSPTTRLLDTRYAARFHQLYSWDKEITNNRSAMMMFNQLLAKYIQNFYDVTNQKIYQNVILSFVSGAFNRSIMDLTATYPDTLPLVFVKFGQAEAHKYPLINNLIVALSGRENLNIIVSIVTSYLKYGYKEGMTFNEKSRSLDPGNADNTTLQAIPTTAPAAAGGTVNFTGLYVNLMIHLIAHAIKYGFDDLKSTGGAPKAGFVNLISIVQSVPPTAAPPPASADDCKKLFNAAGDWPSYSDIITTLIGKPSGTANLVLNRVKNLVSVTATDQLDNGCTLYLALQAIAGQALNLIGVHDNILAYRAAPPSSTLAADLGSIAITAASLNFPYFQDMLTNREEENEYRVLVYSAVLTYLCEKYTQLEVDALNGKAGANIKTEWEQEISNITNMMRTVPSTYSPPTKSDPKTQLKPEDTTYLVDDEIIEPLTRPGDQAGYLRLVRNEVDGDLVSARPWHHLGPYAQPPGATVELKDLKNFGRRWDPDADHVLYSSLAVILKNIIGARGSQTQNLIYVTESIADVTLYMKERYKAFMPVFRMLFKNLSNKCEFLKKFINRNEINCERRWDMCSTDGRANPPTINPWPWKLQDPAPLTYTDLAGNLAKGMMTSKDAKMRFTGILDSISRGCIAIVNSCDQVLREVGDEPKYFELGQNSIKDYKAQYGYEPFMPISSMLAIFKNFSPENYTDFLPVHMNGEDQFKFMYGTRLMLAQPQVQPLLEHNPGWVSLLESFNLLLDTKSQVDKARGEAFMKALVKGLRFIYEARHIKGILTPLLISYKPDDKMTVFQHAKNGSPDLYVDGLFTREDLVVTEKQRASTSDRTVPPAGTIVNNIYQKHGPVIVTNKADVSMFTDHHTRARDMSFGSRYRTPIPVYSVAKSLSETIRLTESSFKEDRIREVVDHLLGEAEKRNSLEVQNIIDLNIVPINVHALMREIPLANLYNYGYTFDRLIIELYYGFQNVNARKLISELCDSEHGLSRVTTAKDMLVQLLLNPYMDVRSNLGETEQISPRFPGENYYEKFVKRMLVGATGNELGRPKFLSDQIFNKVVFGEIYEDETDYSEQGPSQGTSSWLNFETVVNILATILGLFMQSNDRRFGYLITEPRNDPRLKSYFKGVIRYVLKNPDIRAEELAKRIHDYYLNGPLDVAEAGREKETAAITACFAICYVSILGPLLQAMIRENTLTPSKKKEIYDVLDFVLICLGTDMNPGTAYMGWGANLDAAITTVLDNNIAAAALPAVPNIFTALPANTDEIDEEGSANPPAWSTTYHTVAAINTWNLTQPVYEEIKSLLKRAISSEQNTKYNNAVDYHVLGSRYVDALIGALAPPKMQRFRHYSTKLHWLSSGAPVEWNDESEPGANVEPGPHGDNQVFNPKQIKSVTLPEEAARILHIVGQFRFDTVFIRNLIFVVNLYRSVRLKLSQDLTYNKDIVARSASVTRRSITEFAGNAIDRPRLDYSSDPRFKRYLY